MKTIIHDCSRELEEEDMGTPFSLPMVRLPGSYGSTLFYPLRALTDEEIESCGLEHPPCGGSIWLGDVINTSWN